MPTGIDNKKMGVHSKGVIAGEFSQQLASCQNSLTFMEQVLSNHLARQNFILLSNLSEDNRIKVVNEIKGLAESLTNNKENEECKEHLNNFVSELENSSVEWSERIQNFIANKNYSLKLQSKLFNLLNPDVFSMDLIDLDIAKVISICKQQVDDIDKTIASSDYQTNEVTRDQTRKMLLATEKTIRTLSMNIPAILNGDSRALQIARNTLNNYEEQCQTATWPRRLVSAGKIIGKCLAKVVIMTGIFAGVSTAIASAPFSLPTLAAAGIVIGATIAGTYLVNKLIVNKVFTGVTNAIKKLMKPSDKNLAELEIKSADINASLDVLAETFENVIEKRKLLGAIVVDSNQQDSINHRKEAVEKSIAQIKLNLESTKDKCKSFLKSKDDVVDGNKVFKDSLYFEIEGGSPTNTDNVDSIVTGGRLQQLENKVKEINIMSENEYRNLLVETQALESLTHNMDAYLYDACIGDTHATGKIIEAAQQYRFHSINSPSFFRSSVVKEGADLAKKTATTITFHLLKYAIGGLVKAATTMVGITGGLKFVEKAVPGLSKMFESLNSESFASSALVDNLIGSSKEVSERNIGIRNLEKNVKAAAKCVGLRAFENNPAAVAAAQAKKVESEQVDNAFDMLQNPSAQFKPF